MRIGEIAARCGVNPKTIRYYEAIGLLPRARRSESNYRLYEDEDVERIAFVKAAQALGLSLDEIAEVLSFKERGEPPCDYVIAALRRQESQLEERIAGMHRLRAELRDLIERVEEIDRDANYCRLIEHQAAAGAPGDG